MAARLPDRPPSTSLGRRVLGRIRPSADWTDPTPPDLPGAVRPVLDPNLGSMDKQVEAAMAAQLEAIEAESIHLIGQQHPVYVQNQAIPYLDPAPVIAGAPADPPLTYPPRWSNVDGVDLHDMCLLLRDVARDDKKWITYRLDRHPKPQRPRFSGVGIIVPHTYSWVVADRLPRGDDLFANGGQVGALFPVSRLLVYDIQPPLFWANVWASLAKNLVHKALQDGYKWTASSFLELAQSTDSGYVDTMGRPISAFQNNMILLRLVAHLGL
jgi:hypothetical protein